MPVTSSLAAGQAFQQATSVQRNAGPLAQGRHVTPQGQEDSKANSEIFGDQAASKSLTPPPRASGRGQYIDIQI